ncbi:MAG: protein kinase domain-containing protein, partial [Methermicoccaceae archaeon]
MGWFRKKPSVGKLLKKGIALAKRGRYEDAIECYDKALKIDPKDADAWKKKGNALDELGRYEDAIECYDEALKIDPDDKEVKSSREAALNKQLSDSITISLPSPIPYGEQTALTVSVESKLSEPLSDVRINLSELGQYFKLDAKEVSLPTIPKGAVFKRYVSITPQFEGSCTFDIDITSPLGNLTKSLSTEVVPPVSTEVVPPQRVHTPRTPSSFPPELMSLYDSPVLIGQGGFARVFKAERKKDGMVVAIKLPISLDAATGKMFLKEVGVWGPLSHENIVELYDANVIPVPYLEMEYCDGGSLESVQKPLEPRETAFIAMGIASGLRHAHEQRVIHRDLKPSNVLLKDGVPKIADWGLGKVIASRKDSLRGAFTPLYAAPEQLSKKFGKPDHRTDIWQLGVIMYELLTGKLPFEGEEISELVVGITAEAPKPPSELSPSAQGLEPIVMKCLEKRMEERHQSVKEL